MLKYNGVEFDLGTLTDNDVIYLKKGKKEYVIKQDKSIAEVKPGTMDLMDSAITQNDLDHLENYGY